MASRESADSAIRKHNARQDIGAGGQQPSMHLVLAKVETQHRHGRSPLAVIVVERLGRIRAEVRFTSSSLQVSSARRPDCKSVGVYLRRFESCTCHPAEKGL